MKIYWIPFIFFLAFSPSLIFAQNEDNAFNDCAAIIYDGKMLVDDYSPRGTCQLKKDKAGILSVSTVELNENGGTPKKALGFKVAIRNANTNTIWMFSNKTYKKIPWATIVHKCNMGDKVIIITVDQKYALPHNEIEIFS